MAAVQADKAEHHRAPPARLPPARFITDAAEAPALSGAYLLLVTLAVPLTIALPGRISATLHPGRYLYAGSARGPGGLRARLARHLRTDKAPHWHIDRLTLAGTAQGAWIFPGGDECAIIAALGHLPVPIPSFGSTDCRRCASHLLAWPMCIPAKPRRPRRMLTLPA